LKNNGFKIEGIFMADIFFKSNNMKRFEKQIKKEVVPCITDSCPGYEIEAH
jgi:hypothetical protein